jgi:hypothetical protein
MMFNPTPEDERFLDTDYLNYTCLLAQSVLALSGLETMFSREGMTEITYTALKGIIETQTRAILKHVSHINLSYVLNDACYLLTLFQAAQYDIGAQLDIYNLVEKYKALKNIH